MINDWLPPFAEAFRDQVLIATFFDGGKVDTDELAVVAEHQNPNMERLPPFMRMPAAMSLANRFIEDLRRLTECATADNYSEVFVAAVCWYRLLISPTFKVPRQDITFTVDGVVYSLSLTREGEGRGSVRT